MIIKNALQWIRNRIIKTAYTIFEKNPIVIVPIDGGFSSQFERYLIGLFFRNRGDRVKYDISWFTDYGVDMRGEETRNWELLEVFPTLEFEEASEKELLRYRKYFNVDDSYIGKEELIKAPAYIGGYRFDYIVGKMAAYKKNYNWSGIYNILNPSAKLIADSILNDNRNGICTVGVHVRRGDMAYKIEGGYWQVLTPLYFFEVLKTIDITDKNVYFFSNGFDFVEEKILPGIDINSYKLVKGNRDYEDMYLYSLCSIQVASQSSWGIAVFPLNYNISKVLYRPSLRSIEDEHTSDGGTIITIQLTEEMYE